MTRVRSTDLINVLGGGRQEQSSLHGDGYADTRCHDPAHGGDEPVGIDTLRTGTITSMDVRV